MCSIYGAIGPTIDKQIMRGIARRAKDRGRDGGRCEFYALGDYEACLGNWRATPTPEPEKGLLQPYGKMVHNGTLANDKELGAVEGEIDSQTLSRILDRHSVKDLVSSLAQVRGSYALACISDPRFTILAATNYKPLYYTSLNGTVYFSSMMRHFLLPFGHAPRRLAPYSAIDFISHDVASISRSDDESVVVIASAGLDSTVVATKLMREGRQVCLLHFRYGCGAQDKEEHYIKCIAEALGCDYQFLDVDLAKMLGIKSSSLFDKDADIAGPIEGAEFAHEWVPGRNFVFISMAVAWAEAHGYHEVALGNNLEESGAYPDNEEEFTHLLDQAVPYAVQADYGMRITSPVGNLMKHEIVKLGLSIDTPFRWTWSCYRGGATHCGKCGPCYMRREAFRRNNALDPVFIR